MSFRWRGQKHYCHCHDTWNRRKGVASLLIEQVLHQSQLPITVEVQVMFFSQIEMWCVSIVSIQLLNAICQTENREALAFYQSLGFNLVETIENYYRFLAVALHSFLFLLATFFYCLAFLAFQLLLLRRVSNTSAHRLKLARWHARNNDIVTLSSLHVHYIFDLIIEWSVKRDWDDLMIQVEDSIKIKYEML